MPLYEFDCPSCGEPFEKRFGFSDDLNEVTCPVCGGQNVKKRLSAFAVKGASRKSTEVSSASANCSPGAT
jgi:putative FmdB family regulatory protein